MKTCALNSILITGDTEKCINAVFECANEIAGDGLDRVLIYFDELDCMLANNTSDNDTSPSSMLEILLKQMNKLVLKDNDRIILISSTNRPDLLPENLVTR